MPASKTYHSIVLVKQVPDTRQVTGEAMTPEGTLNRGLLPAIFNPEDLNALEMALEVRDKHGGQVTVLTMGPPQAAEVLREALYRGADRVILLTDRKFAGADTLATSYTLQKAVEKLAPYDLVFCGRQAIDGDTAQVGPQVAEKLGLPQITYAEAILRLEGGEVVVQRAFDQGTEMVKSPLPCLLTVVGSARAARPSSVRRRIEYKLAATPLEYAARLKARPEFETEAALDAYLAARGLRIPVWTAADLDLDESRLGLAGSPTQVHKINYVVLEARESKTVAPTPDGLRALVEELIKEYIAT
jgi:electron transfer flavoprotein beta subunit